LNKKIELILVLFITISSSVGANLFFNLLNLNITTLNPTNQTESYNDLHTSNNGMKAVIIFFNNSEYNISAKNEFEFYGGILKENGDWNSSFSNFSGFAGLIPMENITAYANKFPDINIDTNEIIEVQMNYASVQNQAVNSSWYVNGYNGDTNSSIAVMDSGVNPNHDFLQGKIIGWQNFVDQEIISDNNGHGTFISSVITGTR